MEDFKPFSFRLSSELFATSLKKIIELTPEQLRGSLVDVVQVIGQLV